MFNLVSVSDKVQLTTSSAADIEVRVDFLDSRLSTGEIIPDSFKPDNVHTAIAAAATTDILGAPGANVARRVTSIVARNKHATLANTLTLKVVNASSTKEVWQGTLQAGETLVVNEAGTIFVYDTGGGVKQGNTAMSDTAAGIVQAALQADQETTTSIATAVTPGRQQYHPSAAKFWVKGAGGSTTINASYNTTSVANTATGRWTVTIGVDFSGAHWCCQVSVEPASNAGAVANRRLPCVANLGQAAGTVEVNSWDSTATTNVLSNPTSWHVAGFGDQ